MAQFSFECVPGHHKFQLDIPTLNDQRDENDPEYKKLRPQIVCPYPGCGATAQKNQISNSAMDYPSRVAPSDLEARRKANREMTMESMKMAAHAKAMAPPEKVVELDYVPSGEGERSRYGGDRIKVGQGVIESLNRKDPRPVRQE